MFFVKSDETTEANSVKQDQVRLLVFRKDNANGFIDFKKCNESSAILPM